MLQSERVPEPGGPLLPTVGEPGTYGWCEEVVECMNAAWLGKEEAEERFLAAARAAIRYRIWETLAPPPPEEPYGSLEGLIRRRAVPGQAEYMQIAIRFSGLLDEAGAHAADADAPIGGAQALADAAPYPPEVRAVLQAARSGQTLSAAQEEALGSLLLDQYATQSEPGSLDPSMLSGASAAQLAGILQAASAPSPQKRTAAQRKRDRLERTHPELLEAVLAGEMTLKQAYVEAGIDKEVRTLDKLQKLWKAASEEEKARFLSWVQEALQWESRREYDQAVYGENR